MNRNAHDHWNIQLRILTLADDLWNVLLKILTLANDLWDILTLSVLILILYLQR